MSLPPLKEILFSKSTPKKKPRKKVILKPCEHCNYLIPTSGLSTPICKTCKANKLFNEEEMNQMIDDLFKSSPRKGGGKKKRKSIRKKKKRKRKKKTVRKRKKKTVRKRKKK